MIMNPNGVSMVFLNDCLTFRNIVIILNKNIFHQVSV